MRLDATLHKPALIGEAAMGVPEPMRLQAAAVPWRRIVATRVRVMHAYPGVDLSTIWIFASVEVPALRAELGRRLQRD